MEALLSKQHLLIQNIEKIFTNFKKDGPERKTYSNISKRISNLSLCWNEFNSNHTQLCDYQDENNAYFQQDYYETTKGFYKAVLSYLEQYLLYTEAPLSHEKPLTPPLELTAKFQGFPKSEEKEIPPSSPFPKWDTRSLLGSVTPAPTAGTSRNARNPASPGVQGQQTAPQEQQPAENTLNNKADRTVTKENSVRHTGTTSKLEEKLRKQKSNFKAFSRAITNINFDSLSEKWEYEDVIKLIDSRWNAIDCLHWDIDCELYEEDPEYERLFTRYEREYNDIKKALNQKMWSASYRTKTTPSMDIPTFSGDYHRWISFKDLFGEAIHNNRSIPNAQKMQFLKGKVRGEAEKLIQHLNISSDNYQVCWDILNHRYNNTKLIFSSHMNVLMALPVIQQQTAPLIKKIHDTTKECLNAVKNLGVDISTWDPMLVHILSQKLDAETHQDYIESLRSPRDLPTLSDFYEFLEGKFTSLEASRRKQDSNIQKPSSNYVPSFGMKKSTQQQNNGNYNKYQKNNTYNGKPMAKSYHVSSAYKCLYCKSNHSIFFCNDFIKLPNEDKLKLINDLKLCRNCLYDHKGDKCISTKTCRKCAESHNTLLHDALTTSSTSSAQKSNKDNVNVSQSQNNSSEILLATAQIKVLAADGSYHTLRALIDQGSQISLITENAAQQLGLPRRRCKGVVFGLGTQENNCKGAINISASAIHGDYTFNTTVMIMKNLVNNLPNQTFQKPTWPHIQNISLADPQFNISRPVDILLGAEIYALIMMGGIIKGDNESQPLAQQTHLGWLLCGNVVKTYQCNVILNNIEDIQRFWAIEDIADNPLNMSTADYHCVEQYKESTYRQSDGRYVVRLPMKPDATEKLGESKQRAIAQFLQLEKKFHKNQKISEDYKAFINEYNQLRHMYAANSDGNETPAYYLPHHCVLRADSSTTALRVVFNASSPTSTGHSLNDLMYSGPNLQQDLLSLILKWRQYEIAITADIEKMFRQIMVHPEDQKLQKIAWRDNPNQPIQTYNLATVTYGTKAAPFLAMMTLKQLANDEGHQYTSAAKKALEEDFYMDDLLSGSHSIESARQLQSDLMKLLKSGGFNLRKWASNKPELLQDVETSINQQAFDFKYPESTKTLGLRWNPIDDQFSFQVNLGPASKTLTKRVLLSEISKIFDPLGWLSPVTTKLKLLFQRVWSNDVQWDSPLPNEFISEWENIRGELGIINIVRINRWLETQESGDIELHGFCDSSTKALACVIFCKVNKKGPDGTNQSSVTIVAAKARLVPLKRNITLPRLELMACHLLSKLMEKVIKSLPKHTIRIFAWTDSTAALGWLQGDSGRWKPFVANRVEQVKPIIPPECWRYVKSTENPADCASRGITTNQLVDHPLWWTGPNWLKTYNSEEEKDHPVYTTDKELKKSVQTNVATISQGDVISDIVNKQSNFARATRVLARVLRVVSRNRPKQTILSMNELSEAKQMIIRYYQQNHFAQEIHNLQNKVKIGAKSKILNLTPILDQNGLLRVSGRIKHAHINETMKHPLIIPHEGHLTNLLIDQAHKDTFHGGARMSLSRLRQQYWVIGGNRAVKKRLRKCVICRRHDPVKQNQLMGDLPAARINPSRPFYNTGVDFTGFVEIKANKGRGIKTTKGYVAVFVCMVTKAVHLELVSDLSSSAFLAALRRMAARRGAPRHIYCDNGSNFVGASRIMKEEIVNLRETLDEEFHAQAADMDIEFHFNAPSWPSAGGLWEAAVRNLKHHLRRVLGDQKLTFEEFSTLLAQLEACLNSRPLGAISEDPEDINFLTPSHFLASGPTLTIVETERDARTRWQLTQKIFHDVWKRWQTEYLCQLSARSKWQQPQQNQKVGDIVIIHDANLPAGRWPLGRVVELHPGKDGHVRVVSVKTKSGVLQRPIVKLSPLPVNEETNQDNQQSPGTSNQKPRKQGNIAIFKSLAITLLITMLIIPTQSAYHTAQLSRNQSIYFDKISDMHLNRDEWKLVVYYDMNPYWSGVEMVTKFINNLVNSCIKTDKPVLCEIIMLQLRHNYKELDLYNHMLLGQQIAGAHLRVRRGLINGVGNLAHTLFGVLDDQFADQYQKDIELLRRNQKHMALLWKNQTSVVEAQHNLLQRVENTMDQQHKYINGHINDIEKMTNQLKDSVQSTSNSNAFALSVIIATNVIQNLRNIQDHLLETMIDLHYGSFNIHLISPDQFKSELDIISGQLTKDLSLPINNIATDLPKLYHMLKVKAKMTRQYFIIEIRIPLVARDYYEIYRLIPTRHNINNSMVNIIPISEYIAMNIQKDSYFTMTQADLLRCDRYDDVTQLCPLQTPVYHMTSDKSLCVMNEVTRQCAINTEPCKTTWTELYGLNSHLYAVCKQCTVRIICGSRVTAAQLTGNGIISLSGDCVIKSADFTIYSRRQQSNTLNLEADVLKIEIPPINNIIDLPISVINVTSIAEQIKYDNHTYFHQQLNEIGRQIQQMKENGAEVILSDRPSSHDVTQYGWISVVTGVTLCIGLALVWRRLRTCGVRTSSNISGPTTRGAPPPAPARLAAVARPARAQRTPEKLQLQSNARRPMTSIVNLADDSDTEVISPHYARIDKATSPTFERHFSE